MDKKTIFIIAGVIIALVMAWFLFFKKSPDTDKTGLTQAWNKEVQKHYGWLLKQQYVADKAKTNGVSLQEQAMNDAKYLAEQAGFVNPNA